MAMQRMIGMLAFAVSVGVLAACHPRGRAPQAAPAVVPDVDLRRAMDLFRRGDFRRASVILQRVTFELTPGTPELAQVRYYSAESWFQVGDYVQAASEFRKVADEFSTTEYAPPALLRAGDANLRLWRRPELDPEPGQTALATYQELQGRYPGTSAAARAQLHVSQLNEWFAEKNYKNGMFYFRRRAYDSAIIYFKDVIANYPGTRLVPDALLRLVDSYRAIRYIEELKEACANLRQYYPKTDGLAARCPAETGNPAGSSGTP